MSDTQEMADRRKQLDHFMQLPLDEKIKLSLKYIRQWHDHYNGDVAVSFSGGMDSTVLLHMARTIYPDTAGYFVDTGLEYPEIKAHVKNTPNVVTVRPKLTFKQVLDKYGFPLVSKRVSQYVCEVQRSKGETATKRLRMTGIRTDGTFSKLGKIPDKWLHLVDAPFAISDRCCDALKKSPLENIPHPMTGTRAEESQQRSLSFVEFGVNGFDLKKPRSTPLVFWRDLDIWEYVEVEGLEYADCYKGDNAVARTGCMFCMFGVHLEREPNRFQMMEITHPKQWAYCMEKLGIREVLEYIGVPWENEPECNLLCGFTSGVEHDPGCPVLKKHNAEIERGERCGAGFKGCPGGPQCTLTHK